MNTISRRIVLAISAALGLFVGVWAAALPESFYSSFPGLGLMWISVDGPYNEHLIRDVGALYLAVAAATIYAIFAQGLAATRAVGIAWTVFGIPHLAYHLHHLEGLAVIDVVGNVASLGGSVLLGVLILLPSRPNSNSSPLLPTRPTPKSSPLLPSRPTRKSSPLLPTRPTTEQDTES